MIPNFFCPVYYDWKIPFKQTGSTQYILSEVLRPRIVPYLVNVATKEYCSIYLEMGFKSEEFCLKILVLVAAAVE